MHIDGSTLKFKSNKGIKIDELLNCLQRDTSLLTQIGGLCFTKGHKMRF
jgi:hypothetical protein